MKEAFQVLLGYMIMVAMGTVCFAGDDMTDRASRLMSSLNIQTNSEAWTVSRPVYSGSSTMKVGDFEMKRTKATTNAGASGFVGGFFIEREAG
jgi:hypothetical protein